MFAMIFVVLMFLTVQKYPYIKKERKTSLFVEVPIYEVSTPMRGHNSYGGGI